MRARLAKSTQSGRVASAPESLRLRPPRNRSGGALAAVRVRRAGGELGIQGETEAEPAAWNRDWCALWLVTPRGGG